MRFTLCGVGVSFVRFATSGAGLTSFTVTVPLASSTSVAYPYGSETITSTRSRLDVPKVSIAVMLMIAKVPGAVTL